MLESDFAAMTPDCVSLGIDKDQAGPGLNAEAFPDGEVGIVYYRMPNAVAQHGLGYDFGVFLFLELGRMHAYNHQVIWPGGLDFFKFGNDVHAVYAPQGPEIQEHELALELIEFDWAGGIDPRIRDGKRLDWQALGEKGCGWFFGMYVINGYQGMHQE